MGYGSSVAFVRELASVVLGGLHEPARCTARAGTRRIITDGSARALVILLGLTAWSRAHQVSDPAGVLDLA